MDRQPDSGKEYATYGLGTSLIGVGKLNDPADAKTPLYENGVSNQPGNSNRYYALSNVFVVPNNAAAGSPTITGTPRVGRSLTADTSGITDSEGTDNQNLTYQWVRVDGVTDADIEDATRSTYRPTDEDVGKQIKVKVSFTDDAGFDEGLLTSEPTAAIVAADVLVKNTDKIPFTIASVLNTTFPKDAQAFITGSNTDGYELHSIGVLIDTITTTSTAANQLQVTLNHDSNGNPGDLICTLDDPPSFSSSALHTFTAPTTGTLCPK